VGHAYPATEHALQEEAVPPAPHRPRVHRMHAVTKNDPAGQDDGLVLIGLPDKNRPLSTASTAGQW
jgi:hypothetical protein